MSKISVSLKKAIKEIKQLADGSIVDQLKCSKLIRQNMFYYGEPKRGVNESIIRELLPIIIKFMGSNDHGLQQEGANSITCITNTPDESNAQLVINGGVIPKLINLLSSTNTDVLISALEAFRNIAYDFPENVIEILPSIIQYLQSKDLKISYQAARYMANISSTSEKCIAAIFEANGVKPLIEILESSNYITGKEILIALRNIISCKYEFCQRILDLGALKSVRELCDRLFVGAKKCGKKHKSDEEKCIKLLVFQIVKAVTSYGEAPIDLIIGNNFIPTILQQIKSGSTPLIKIESINVIENVISKKHGFIPALIQHNIFSSCYSNLGSTNADLVIASLTLMCNIIELFEGRDIIRQKIRECGGPTKLTNLCNHSDVEIRDRSTMIYDFLLNVKAIPIAGVPVGSNQQVPEYIELSDDEDTPVVKTPQNGRQRKRPATSQPSEPLRTSKRLRGSLHQKDTENTSNVDGAENFQYNDFYDHPRSFSPDGAAPIESNRNDHSGQQSFIGDDTVAADGQFRLNVKVERSPTPDDFDIPTSAASRQSPDLPVAASTHNETAQNATNHSPPVYRPRFSLNNSFTLPVSTNNGNFQNNHVERHAAAVNSEIAATANEIFGNSTNPSPSGDQFSRPDSTNSLPDPASTNNGTMPNSSPLRNSSPIHQPVITHELPNQATTAVTENIIRRDETIIYWNPHGSMIHQYCQKLGIQLNRDNYDEVISKIKFTQITSNSKPDKYFTANDKSGFGCLSILLTGNEDASSTIRDQIIDNFIDNLNLKTADKTKLKEVTRSRVMLAEHFQTIAALLGCRILVYSNGWKKYGSWETENSMIPLFVLEKNENGYQIVLDLKNDV